MTPAELVLGGWGLRTTLGSTNSDRIFGRLGEKGKELDQLTGWQASET
jgi:hypothetical protein